MITEIQGVWFIYQVLLNKAFQLNYKFLKSNLTVIENYVLKKLP